MEIFCCNIKIKLDFLLEGEMPNQDGSFEYRGTCKVCGTVYYIKIWKKTID